MATMVEYGDIPKHGETKLTSECTKPLTVLELGQVITSMMAKYKKQGVALPSAAYVARKIGISERHAQRAVKAYTKVKEQEKLVDISR